MAEGGIASIETAQPIPAPDTEQESMPEQEATPEQKRGKLSAGTARLMAGMYDRKFLNPAQHTISDSEKTAFSESLKRTRPVDIDFTAIESLSVASRNAHWNEQSNENSSLSSFKAQNDKWNQQVHMWLEENLKDDAAAPEVMDERRAALKSLGLADPENDKQLEGSKLYGTVETFRKRYFSDTSNVGGFVEDLVKDCPKDSNGAVDIDILQKRLDSIDDVLNAFGKDEEIHIIVRDYASVVGLLSDKPSIKGAYAEDLAALLGEDVQNPTLQAALHKLLEKHNEMAKGQEEEQKKAEETKDKGEGTWDDDRIKEEVKKAKERAQRVVDVTQYNNEEFKIRSEFLNGVITSEQYNEAIKNLERNNPNIKEGVIEAPTRDDYIKIMREAELSEDQIYEELMHEDAHFKVAEGYGLQPHYVLRLETKDNGDIIGHSHTNYIEPTGKPEDEIREIHDRILIAPGLEAISDIDRQGLGIRDEEYEMANSIKKRFALVNMSSDDELAFIRNIQEQRKRIKAKIDPDKLPTQERESTNLRPDEFIEGEEMYNRFVDSAVNALKALGIYDENQHSPAEFSNKLEAIGGKDKYNAENWRKVLAEQAPSDVQVITSTSLDALIEAAKNGDAVIIPYNETHLGVLQPGENSIYHGPKGEISVKLYTPGSAEPTYVPLEALLQNELPLYDVAEGEAHERYQNKSRAFILRKNTV